MRNILLAYFISILLAAGVTAGAVSAQGSSSGIRQVSDSTVDGRLRIATQNLLIDAVSLLEEGQVAQARTLLEVLAKKDPGNDALHYYLALCDLEVNDIKSAEQNLGKAIAIDSTNLWYLDRMAMIYSLTGRISEATDIYLTLDKKAPGKHETAFSLSMLGDRCTAENRDEEAMAYFGKALEYDPDYPVALLGQAKVYGLQGNYPMLMVVLDKFVRNEYVNPAMKAEYLDNMLQNFSPRVRAVWVPQLDKLVDTGVQVHPADSSMLMLASRWFYWTDRKEKGEAYLDRLLEAFPESMDANLFRIMIFSERKDYEGMIRQSEKVLGFCERKDKPGMYSIIGDGQYNLGDKKGAYRTYEKALKIDPDYLSVLNNYAYFLSLDGEKLRKAEKMSRKVIEAEPDNPTYLDTYGWILHLLGRDDQARLHFKRAIVYGGSDSAVVLRHFAEVLRSLGETQLANYYESQADRKSK